MCQNSIFFHFCKVFKRFIYVYGCFAFLCVRARAHAHTCAHKGQKRALDFLKLLLSMLVGIKN